MSIHSIQHKESIVFSTAKTSRIYLIFMLVLLGSATMVTPAFAAGITVNTFADEDGAGADCSLREAITAANTDAPYGGCPAGSGADTINLPDGLYTLTQGSQLPTVSTTIIINGNTATIQADIHCGHGHLPNLRSDRCRGQPDHQRPDFEKWELHKFIFMRFSRRSYKQARLWRRNFE